MLNRIVAKLRMPDTAKGIRAIKEIIVHANMVMHRVLPSTEPMCEPSCSSAPQPRWKSSKASKNLCGICDLPTSNEDVWCQEDRLRFHQECIEMETCPLCNTVLQPCPLGITRFLFYLLLDELIPNKKKATKRRMCDVDVNRSMIEEPAAKKSVTIRMSLTQGDMFTNGSLFYVHSFF